MSDFTISSSQRQRLLAGSYEPLDFDVKPWGCKPGAVYVLSWMAGPSSWEPGYGVRAPRVPVWWLTVVSVQRHRKGFWRVRFDVSDNRDRDVFLACGAGDGHGYTSGGDPLRAGPVPDREWLDIRSKTISEFDHQRRLASHAEKLRERARWKRERKRAA